MQAINHFIVNVPKKYIDSLSIGETTIFLESKYNEFENRVAYGEIISVPLAHKGGARVGDTLIFHHHVTTNKALDIGDNRYVSMYDPSSEGMGQSVAYRSKDSGELHMLSDWLFVQPEDADASDDVSESGIVVRVGSFKKTPLLARIYMLNDSLREMGVRIGDRVGFSKNSDYRIVLDNGDVVYRMKVEDISYVWEEV